MSTVRNVKESRDLEPKLDRPWTVCLIQHAHTDIGYTDTQNRIARHHVQFIDQALDIARRAKAGDAGLQGFVWNSECFWSIEQWLKATPAARHGELAAAIRDGTFGLSGTYLHFTELVDDHTLRRMLAKGTDYARALGVPLDTAMSADVNGFSWGYAQALHDAGIKNLLVCLHSLHGMAPIGKRQGPFFWETPQGDEILVWLNEHYNLGNILGLAPGALLTYSFADELHPKPMTPDHWGVAEIRLPRYLRRLEEDGYPADFVPIHIAGVMTDNSPPSEALIRFIHQWNARHGGQIRIEMSTPSAVGARVRKAFNHIPHYRGDWPDWWSDGVAATPDQTRLCRHAQREYRYLRALAEKFATPIPAEDQHRIEDAIALYTEHTFNHSDAMHTPWDLSCKAIGAGKGAYAAAAYARTAEAMDTAFEALGEAPLAAGRPFFYQAVNPLPTKVRDVAKLYLEFCDFNIRDLAATVVDTATGKVLPHQKTPAPRGFTFDVRLDLAPGATARLELREGLPTLSHTARSFCDAAAIQPEGSCDVIGAEKPRVLTASTQALETPFVRIAFAPERGIVSWFDKGAGCELLRADADHAPFMPVYDVTPVTPKHDDTPHMMKSSNILTRGRMGRNRKGADARYFAGRLESVKVTEVGPLRATVQLDYAIEGCTLYRVLLSAWADLPRVDVSIRLNKQSVWEPENLYVALPFTSGGDAEPELWVEKAGALVRPRQDQLPDSLADFYCLQDGLVFLGRGRGLALATPDTPLLQLGDLTHGQRHVMGSPQLPGRPLKPYSWVMTNYWETNFEASLGGFHEFTYRLEWGPHIQTPQQGIDLCHALNHGIKNFRVAADAR
ncbi:MAG: hypothetical protein PHE83_12840 [Opitutaceae bacterium]|nr:hypothetical protein [Opitutaceae bacterium]